MKTNYLKNEISKKAYEWAKIYSKELQEFIEKDYDKFVEIMNIEREKKNPRKDYAKYSDIYPIISFFDNKVYDKSITETSFDLNPRISKEIIKNFLIDYSKSNYALESDENCWFNNVKEVASKYNFCTDNKIYKQDPSIWNGNINDACEILRLAFVLRKVTPNLFSIMKILGNEECTRRINLFIATI